MWMGGWDLNDKIRKTRKIQLLWLIVMVCILTIKWLRIYVLKVNILGRNFQEIRGMLMYAYIPIPSLKSHENGMYICLCAHTPTHKCVPIYEMFVMRCVCVCTYLFPFEWCMWCEHAYLYIHATSSIRSGEMYRHLIACVNHVKMHRYSWKDLHDIN